MCCFSRPINQVRGTNIFARSGPQGRQYIVYSMHVNTPHDVAMILPLPVRGGTGEKAVRFIGLENYSNFFVDMIQAFMPPPNFAGKGIQSAGIEAPRLEVHNVGSFEASYVPTVRDFSRLDERFRLPEGTWDKLPQYKHYGFAVFKLKPGAKTVHPMAFDFPRADPRRLFFPTVHIHDGKVHETAGFDHKLFCQKGPADLFSLRDWRESERLAGDFIKAGETQSIVAGSGHLYLKSLAGRLKNQDTWLG